MKTKISNKWIYKILVLHTLICEWFIIFNALNNWGWINLGSK